MNTTSATTSERLLSRRELAGRWNCCTQTISRKEAAGFLRGLRVGSRFLRYRLSDIERIEREAAGGEAAQ